VQVLAEALWLAAQSPAIRPGVRVSAAASAATVRMRFVFMFFFFISCFRFVGSTAGFGPSNV
jgi:hypothetical protein